MGYLEYIYAMTVEQVSSIQYVYSDNVYQCSREYNDARTIETPTTRSREAAKRLCRDAQGDGPRKPEDLKTTCINTRYNNTARKSGYFIFQYLVARMLHSCLP